MPDPVLWYFADPMCSWCWGFSPVFEKIMARYRSKMRIALVMGGLRPGTREPLNDTLSKEILHHWHEVQRTSGQTFNFEDALPPGLVYDTEPASRAVLVVGGLQAEMIFPYFNAVQAAFYTAGEDVTQKDILLRLAGELGLDRVAFSRGFDSEMAKSKVQLHFRQAREFAVQGFPTIVAQNAETYEQLAYGYRTYDVLSALIDQWLVAHPATGC